MKWLQNTSFVNIRQVKWLEILALMGLGLILAVVQANLRLPLKLPGWRGIIWLTPLISTRLLTSHFAAASITGLSAAGFSLLLGVRAFPDEWLFYFVVGELIDIAYHKSQIWQKQVWFWAIIAGLVHLLKPLTKVVMSLSGVGSYGAASSGLIYPLLTHLLFGLIAGAMGATIVLAAKNRRKIS
jgi:hypothetical protein